MDRFQIENKINSLLKVFDIFQEKEKLLCEFPAGMCKKAAFIATIIHIPELKILDEPFEGIDPISAKTIKDSLKKSWLNVVLLFLSLLMAIYS